MGGRGVKAPECSHFTSLQLGSTAAACGIRQIPNAELCGVFEDPPLAQVTGGPSPRVLSSQAVSFDEGTSLRKQQPSLSGLPLQGVL